MSETNVLLGIIVFWLLMSTGMSMLETDNHLVYGTYDMNVNQTSESFEPESTGGEIGILEVFKYIGFFISMTIFYFPVFDNVIVTALINIVLIALRIVTWYIVIRLIRGGG